MGGCTVRCPGLSKIRLVRLKASGRTRRRLSGQVLEVDGFDAKNWCLDRMDVKKPDFFLETLYTKRYVRTELYIESREDEAPHYTRLGSYCLTLGVAILDILHPINHLTAIQLPQTSCGT